MLRSKLRSAHVLHIPRVKEKFVLHTDASGVAVKATLGQLDQKGVEHPLAFANHKLSGPQCTVMDRSLASCCASLSDYSQ